MTDQEIIEGNKLIAEFMGVEHTNNTWHYKKHELPYYWGGYSWLSENLFYHTSWDWLMSVVEKIEQDYHTVLHDKRFTISNADRCFEKRASTKIEAVWLAITEYIKWHNQNK